MPTTYVSRPRNPGSSYAVEATAPSRQARHIHVSTTNTGTHGIDFLAVERAVNDDLPKPELNPAEQHLAARLMTNEGYTIAVIADRLGTEQRTVSRWRAAWKREQREGT
ncbi:helix-turn-helix domain-containing protein [Streptomyces sp. LHD-70]|uniref:helix-turn-helix domain-containing protein n=1 Tax=Streptomyces sp. LHD-70 TaxID=3072140 RepID=UPI00280DB1B5|nr:helix-turn-helix domain-containing protein [Streptomyces sp. LHD-70]MDQ8707853.1 helix-turn-helix domain-containing protein [Streptomyces sp. LHD-70]